MTLVLENKFNKAGYLVSVALGSSLESVDKNPFSDPVVAEYYREIYDKAEYECRTAFDPDFDWTAEEEVRLVRKLDFRVALTSCILFVGLQVDRSNLALAVSDNMLKELHLTTNDYNMGNTLFLVAFLLAELPSQLISKRLGPDIFIPIQMCGWSIVAAAQFWLTNKAGFYATRVLIGMLEGGFIADLVLWLSYFYTSKELPIRLSYFWTALSLCQIAVSLMAFGILRMRGILGYSGWRWLFLIEGLFTLLIGIAAFYLMVPSALQTKNWLHPKGWFTEREEKIVVNRVLRDDPSKGDMHNRQPLTLRAIWRSLSDYDLWPVYAIGLMAYIPTATLGPYLTLNLKQLGFSTFNTNLLTIPFNVLHIVFLLVLTWGSERINERSWVCFLLPIYSVPIMAVIRWWPGSGVEPWPSWVLATLLLGGPYIHAICVAWVSRNSNSIRTRSVSAAVYNIFVQLGNIVARNIYRVDDLPLYHRGNMQLFFLALAMFPILGLTRYYYVWRNNSREKIWQLFLAEEKEQYIRTTEDEGNKRLDFRFDY